MSREIRSQIHITWVGGAMNSQGQRLPVSSCSGTHEILREAVRVLCTNTVPFKSRLSIDAIIGITIDNTEIIFVNIHESIDQSECAVTDRPSENNRRQSVAAESNEAGQVQRANVVRKSEHGRLTTDETWSGSHSRQCQTPATGAVAQTKSIPEVDKFETCSGQNVTFVGKVEPQSDVIEIEDDDDKDFKVELSADVDAMSAETGDCAGYEAVECRSRFALHDYFESDGPVYKRDNWSPSMTDAGNISHAADGRRDYLLTKGANIGRQGSGMTYRCRTCFKTFIYYASYVRHRRRHHAWAPCSAVATATNGGDFCLASGGRGAVKTAPSAIGASGRDESTIAATSARVTAGEVGTVYTCSVCGQKIRHLSTFIRHKKQHEGVEFNCDICGFVTSRRDSLMVHRRRCVTKCRTFLGVE